MVHTLASLQAMSDKEIDELMLKRGYDLHLAWNETVHPESLFEDFYNDFVRNKLTTEQQKELLSMLNEECDGAYETLDECLKQESYLCEDAGELPIGWEGISDVEFYRYFFKWCLASTGWADEFLVNFLNNEHDESNE